VSHKEIKIQIQDMGFDLDHYRITTEEQLNKLLEHEHNIEFPDLVVLVSKHLSADLKRRPSVKKAVKELKARHDAPSLSWRIDYARRNNPRNNPVKAFPRVADWVGLWGREWTCERGSLSKEGTWMEY
jgi:hypothetical protein